MFSHSSYVVAVLAILLVGFNSLSANWFVATSSPPMSNVPAPINIGTTTQQKQGNFMAYIMAAASSTWSPRYCDELGNNCWSPGSGGQGGSTFGGIFTRNSFGACSQTNPFTGSCSCPSGYTSSMFAISVSGGEQFFHQCWSTNGPSLGTSSPVLGTGAIETMRGMTTSFLPPPPPGLSEWPDYLICDIHATQKHYFMPFSRIFIVGTDQVVSYSPDGSGAGGYSVRSNGTYYSRAAVMANCGPDSTGSDIVSICNAGYCGYY